MRPDSAASSTVRRATRSAPPVYRRLPYGWTSKASSTVRKDAGTDTGRRVARST